MFQVIETNDMVPIDFAQRAIIASSENSVWILDERHYTRVPIKAREISMTDRLRYNKAFNHRRCFFFVDDEGFLRLRIMPLEDYGPYGLVSSPILSAYTLI